MKIRLTFVSLLILVGFFVLTDSLTAQEPTSQPTGLTVSNLGSGTLTLSWTGGDGANTIILAKEGSAVDSDPVDATSYTADHFSLGSEIGTGNFVVFSGSASTALIQGLSAGTTYHFAAYEFNTGGVPSPDYLTIGPATTSTTTSAALDLYSFQTGDAEDATTWTTDATGNTQVNSAVPGPADDATVLANTTVTVTTNNFDVNQFTVAASGTLVLGSTDSHDYGTLTGTGLVQSASAHPAVSVNTFATTAGGTFEYITTAGSFTLTSSDATTYNNLIIDNTSITIGLDLTVNGTLTLENSSTLTLGNDATARTFSFDDIQVDLGSAIATNGTSTGASTPHTATITGNVTNNGSIDFTAQTGVEYTSDPTVGVVEVTFSGTDNQTLSCSGNTDFNRIIIDKGSDQTASLTVSSTSTSNFRVFGRNNEANTASGDDANPTINKAISIQNGTLELGANISIESLTEGGADFFIPENAALHINGASVSTTIVGNGTNRQGVTIIGKLQVSSGSFDTGNSLGIAFAANSELDIDGGSLTSSQLRTSTTTIGTVNSLAYNQSGGTVTINRAGANSFSHKTFDMEAANTTDQINTFTMSDGTLTISNPSPDGGMSVITRAADFSVTGGTIIAEVTDGFNFTITVNGAFHNLTLQEGAGGSSAGFILADDGPITMTELNVNNNLTLDNRADFDAGGDDINVGGDFSIPALTIYTPGSNTTTFNGTGNQTFTVAGTITSGLNNLAITNTTGTVTIDGNIELAGTFDQPANSTMDLDASRIGGTGTITVSGEVQTSNSNGLTGASNTTFENTLAGVTLNNGSNIVFDAAGAQTISARTDYDGLQIGGSGIKSLAGATTISGVLNIAAGELSIGSNTLTLNGTITGDGTITGSSTSNISVGGTGDLGTIDFTTGGEELGDFTVNRTTSGTVDFEEDFTIHTSVTLTDGFVNLPDNITLTLGSSGSPATVSGGSSTAYFNTDATDDDNDTSASIEFFHEGTDVEIPVGYNPFFSISISCPTCSGHRFRTRLKRGPYNSPPVSGGRVTTDVVAAQWDLTKISGATVDVTVTLGWSGSAETTGLGTDVGISVWDTGLGVPFWDVGNNISAKSGSDPFSQTRTINLDSNDRHFLGVTNDQSPLPVTLLSFTGGMTDEGNIELQWETADEQDNDFFQVQRSTNGLGDWEPLGYVAGNGNSDELIRYSFTDERINKDSGFLYYRLKQVDFNGVFEYSPIISVAIDEDLVKVKNSWRVFPNPSDGHNLQIVLIDPGFNSDDRFRFRLFNMKGQVLHDGKQTAARGASDMLQKISQARSGIYVLEISSENGVERHRLIKK